MRTKILPFLKKQRGTGNLEWDYEMYQDVISEEDLYAFSDRLPRGENACEIHSIVSIQVLEMRVVENIF